MIAEINDALYIRSIHGGRDNISIHTNCALQQASVENEEVELAFEHKELEHSYTHHTEAVIAATGYQYHVPPFLEPLRSRIQWDQRDSYDMKRNYSIDSNKSLFVQNADLHTHGFNSADLGMGPYRNATILNAIVKRKVFMLERDTAFQTFGLPAC